jgi:hypothetical protein
MQISIPVYEHKCRIIHGPRVGQFYHETVFADEVENQQLCTACGDPLATPQQIAAHIYRELTRT